MSIETNKRVVRKSSSRRRSRFLHFTPTLESLDQRLVRTTCAVGPMGVLSNLEVDAITSVSGSLGTTGLEGSSSTEPKFLIQFNRKIDRFSLQSSDLKVEKLGADGAVTPLSSQTTKYTESFNSDDPTMSSVLLSFDTPLGRGNYQVVLSGMNTITDPKGKLHTSPNDQVLTDFSIGGPADAESLQDLGTVNATTGGMVVPISRGGLDDQIDKIVLGTGNTWTLSPLFGKLDASSYRVSLYNADHQLIANTLGSDLSAINENLGSGTYYFQFFSTGSPVDDSKSSLTITFTATPIKDMSGAVTSVVPFNANAQSDNPDSVEVQLSGPTIPPEFQSTATTTYIVVDGQGTERPVDLISDDPANNKMLLALTGNLPTGHYTLEAILLGPTSSTPTITEKLGSFASVSHALPANSLGSIFPQTSASPWENAAVLAPGGSVDQQFSIIQGQDYRMQLSNGNVSGKLFRVFANGSKQSLSGSISDGVAANYYMSPGIYEIDATNSSETDQPVAFKVTSSNVFYESLSNSGVVQSSACVGHGTLVGGSTSSGNQTVETVAPSSSVPIVIGGTTRDSNPTTSAPVESSGSFRLVALNPTPVGSFGAAKAASTPSVSEEPISTETMVLALNSTIFLKPAMISHQNSSQINLDQAPRPAISDKLALEPIAVLEKQRQQTEVVNSTDPALVDGQSPIETSTLEHSQAILKAIEASIQPASTLGGTDVSDQPSFDPSALAVELRSLAAPLGFLLGACVVHRQVKVARRNSGLAFATRPWTFFHQGWRLGACRASKPGKFDFE